LAKYDDERHLANQLEGFLESYILCTPETSE